MKINIYFILFIALTAILLVYYLYIFSRLIINAKQQNDNQPFKGTVSIIICGLNELDNIKKNLVNILKQQYKTVDKKIEVVFVNDGSTDESADFLQTLSQQHPQLKVVNIEPENKQAGKKNALITGINKASGDIVVLTDADCQASSPFWAATMAENFNNSNTQINLGYAPYNLKNTLVSWLVLYETTFTAIQYLNYALMGMPYMGVGRNLAYRKSFFTNKSFNHHPKNVDSGDDDLFVNYYANAKNTQIEINANAHCYSNPPKSLRAWVSQKKRHLSTGKFYKLHHKLLLGLYAFTQTVYVACFLLSIIWSNALIATILLFLLKNIIQLFILFKTFEILKRKINVLILLALDLVQPLYYVLFFQSIFLTNKVKWK